MQQLHHASLKALKRRQHAASVFRRASLSLDTETLLGGQHPGQHPQPQQQVLFVMFQLPVFG